jgi:hypothetical protein
MPLLEFTIEGPPVSHQTNDKANLHVWKAAVRSEAAKHWTGSPLTVGVKFTVMNFYEGPRAPLEDDNMEADSRRLERAGLPG